MSPSPSHCGGPACPSEARCACRCRVCKGAALLRSSFAWTRPTSLDDDEDVLVFEDDLED